MWGDLLSALALMLIIEGILPFTNPEAFRRAIVAILSLDTRDIRLAGLMSMLIGIIILYFVR